MSEKDLTIKDDMIVKYLGIYSDHLKGKSTRDISTIYNLKRETIRSIIRRTANYCDLSLGNKEQIQIEKDRTQLRVTELREQIDSINEDDKLTNKEAYDLTLSYLKEVRANEELIYKINGLLKQDFNKLVDNRKLIIVHNMKESKINEPKRVDQSIRKTITLKNRIKETGGEDGNNE